MILPYVPNIHIAGGIHNSVIVATEHDSVYAFNADRTSAAPPFWKTSLLPPGAATPLWSDVFPKDAVAIRPEVGITGTPVIDQKTHTLYVASMDKEPGKGFMHRLSAIDLSTGANRSVVIAGAVEGKADDNHNGVVTFNARQELQRYALLFWHDNVYVAYTSFGDSTPFHGWVFAHKRGGK